MLITKKIIFGFILSLTPFISHAGYAVMGTFTTHNQNSSGVISFSCPPPNVTCFIHHGDDTSPKSSQKVIIKVVDVWYDFELTSASTPIETPVPGVLQGGVYEGVVIN